MEGRSGVDPEALQAATRVEPAEDRGPEERAGRHPEERQRTDDPERARPSMALEEVRGGRRPDRNEDAATDPLDDPARNELVDRLTAAGDEAANDEDDER